MRIKRASLKIIIPYLISILILWVMGLIINTDLIAFGVYVLFLFNIYKLDKKFIVKYLFMIIMFSYHLFSVFVSENFKIIFYNLKKESFRTGAFIPLLLYYLLFFIVIFVLESNRKEEINNNKYHNRQLTFGRFGISEKKQIRIISTILFIIIAVMVVRMLKNGFYNLAGIDRFEFRNTYFSGFDEKFYTYILWLLPIPLLGNNIRMSKSANLFFVIYCVYLISVGDKFGSLFIAFYFYMLVSWATKEIDKKSFFKIGIVVVVVFIGLLSFIAFQVLYVKGSWDYVKLYFNNRLTGGQSDLWWAIFSEEKGESWRVMEFFKDEVSAIFNKQTDIMNYNFGIYKMMRETAPDIVVNNYLLRGIRFSASTQATLFYYFKYTGLYVGSTILGVATYYFVNNAVTAFRKCDLIRSVLYTMFISKLIQVMIMSEITMFGNITTILGMLVLVFLRIVEKQKHRIAPSL